MPFNINNFTAEINSRGFARGDFFEVSFTGFPIKVVAAIEEDGPRRGGTLIHCQYKFLSVRTHLSPSIFLSASCESQLFGSWYQDNLCAAVDIVQADSTWWNQAPEIAYSQQPQ